MKKTQWLFLLRDIQKTWVSFLSIVLFVAMGMAIFLGIRWNCPAMQATVNDYLEAHSAHDLVVSFPYGLNDTDLRALKSRADINELEPSYTGFGMLMLDGKKYVLVLQSTTTDIDRAELVEGRMPSAPNEIGVEQQFLDRTGMKLGDTFTLDTKTEDKSYLKERELTITALVRHPAYFANGSSYARGISDLGDGSVDFFAILNQDAFNPETYDHCYPQVLIRSDALRNLDSYGDAYKTQSAQLASAIKALGETEAPRRVQEIRTKHQKELDDALKQLNDAQKELDDANRELDDAKKKMADAAKEIADGETKLKKGEKELAAAQTEYARGQKAYKAGVAELNRGLETLQRELRQAGFPTDFAQAQKALIAMQKELQAQKNAMADGQNMVHRLRNTYPALNSEDANKLVELILGLMSEADYVPGEITIHGWVTALEQLQDALNVPGTLEPELQQLLNVFGMNPSEMTTYINELVWTLNNLSPELSQPLPDMVQDAVTLAVLLGAPLEFDEMTAILEELYGEAKTGLIQIQQGLDGIAEYYAGADELAVARRELDDALKEIGQGEKELDKGRKELEDGKKEYAENEIKIQDAEKKIADATGKLDDKWKEYEKAKKDLEKFQPKEKWTVLERKDNESVAAAGDYARSSEKLALSMALLFILVGMLICYTSVARIVNETTVLAGVQKALGFRRGEVTAHYMLYSVLAALLGIVLGTLSGYFLIQTLTNDEYAYWFDFGPIDNYFSLMDVLALGSAELALICCATWLPCRRMFRKPAIELLRGNTSGMGRTHFYEKSALWKRMSLYSKTTVNNLVSDTPRMIATLVGVSGCLSLIIMSLTLWNSLRMSPVRHFSDVWLYDAAVVSDKSIANAQQQVEKTLSDQNIAYMPLYRESVYMEAENKDLMTADLLVLETTRGMEDFLRLTDWETGENLTLPEDGAVISRTYQKHNHTNIGDTVHFYDNEGIYRSFVVSGVSQHYLSSVQITMSPAYYETVMGKKASSNTVFLNYGDSDPETLNRLLTSEPAVFSLKDDRAFWIQEFENMSQSTEVIIYVGLFLATVMAMMVLLNLNIVCVNEKRNELIIMRINGFSLGAVKRYIYQDNIVLTLMGLLIGTGLGIGFGYWILGILQRNGDNYYSVPSIPVCLAGVALTVFFSLISNVIALHKIDKMRISDLKR